MAIKPLPFDRLRLRTDPGKLPFESTADLPTPATPPGQDRAMRALAFGAGIQASGYNLYVSGPSGTGRHRAVFETLSRIAGDKPPPTDWCYVHNFAQPDRPQALRFPAGEGAKFRDAVRQFAHVSANLKSEMRTSTSYRQRKDEIDTALYTIKDAALDELRRAAERSGLLLMQPRPGRFEFKPQRDGLALTETEYRALSRATRDRLQTNRRKFRRILCAALEALSDLEARRDAQLRALENETAKTILEDYAKALLGSFRADAKTIAFLDALGRHAAANTHIEYASENREAEKAKTPFDIALVTADRLETGVPVTWCASATAERLTGAIASKHNDEVAGYRIHGGALHRANGGFLLFDALQMLRQRPVWDVLKDVLRSGQIILGCGVGASAFSPDPIPFDGKIVLFGEPWVFERLRALDHDFHALFKVQVDFASVAPRDDAHCMALLQSIAAQTRRDNTRQLERSAAARLIDEASRQAGDAEKISVRTGGLNDLTREASSFAERAGATFIHAEHLERALDARGDRAGQLKSREQEMVRRRMIFIDTEMAQAGQVNALTMVKASNGGSFGAPARITATVGAGAVSGVTIERIANYTMTPKRRGAQTLAGYITSTYAKFSPLSLSASVAFEQCYGPVDGDSASAAELLAILSAIAGIPLRQSIGVTGAINLRGELQPVGAINQKIEGFYDVCMLRGLSPKHGVLIPAANSANLMLREDVCSAARRGMFSVYPVTHIAEAIEILSGRKAGAAHGNRRFWRGTFNRKVADALREMARPRTLRPVDLDSWWG